MIPILGIAALLLVVFVPGLWVRYMLARHGDERGDFPGTGGELARHLLDRAGLARVAVEVTELGDHYDPAAKAVRLKPQHHDGRSLTAVVVAAHECGHALQDRDGYRPLWLRTRLAKTTRRVERVGSVIGLATGLFAGALRSPLPILLGVGALILTRAASVAVHLITLPVELDASFQRALPMLDQGGYLAKEDLPAARKILKACALTYVAGSLVSLLNLWQWIRYIR